jgi:hypothetical protein
MNSTPARLPLKDRIAFFYWSEARKVFVMTEGLHGRELGAFKKLNTLREQVERWNQFIADSLA